MNAVGLFVEVLIMVIVDYIAVIIFPAIAGPIGYLYVALLIILEVVALVKTAGSGDGG